jgi:hypothetical protein
MSKDKVTNIDKTPNDFVKEKAEQEWLNDPNHQDYEFTNPITNEKESEPRFLVRGRLAQWTHYIVDELNRLNNVYAKCKVIMNAIDEQVAKEKESNNG